LFLVTVVFINTLLPFKLFAQAPVISYSSPQTYVIGAAIAALAPTSSGVGAAGYGSNPVTVGSGFSRPYDVKVDALGNVYVADFGNNAVKKIPAGGGAPVIIGSGFELPASVAVDAKGNVYVADYGHSAIKQIPVGGGAPVTVGSGFSLPFGVAVDGSGNVYVADYGNNAIKKIPVGGGAPVILGSGFSRPTGVAVDASGNVYVADEGNNAIKKIPVGGGAPVILGSGFSAPWGVAADAIGNVFVADTYNNAIKKIPAGGGAPIVIGSGFSDPFGVATSTAGSIYVADEGHSAVKEIIPTGGYYISSALPAGLNFDNATGIISGTPTTNIPATNYTITAYNAAGSGSATVNITVNVPPPTISYTSPQTYTIGTAINALAPVSSLVAAPGYSTIPVAIGSGFNNPRGVAADAAGNVYLADYLNNAVKRIPKGGGAPVTIGSGFLRPIGVAVDARGNVYVADQGNNAVKEIPAGGGAIVTLGSFLAPSGLTIDAAGNIYVTDGGDDAVYKIPVGGGSPVIINSFPGSPSGVAVDASGNVYVTTNGGNNSVLEEIPVGGGPVVTLGSGFVGLTGVAVDAAGNVYVADYSNNVVKEIPAAGGGAIVTLGSGFVNPYGIAADGAGNLYIADSGNSAVKKIKPIGGYYIGPFLPSGLSFASATGIIRGTPTAISPQTNYTITAYNASGGSSAIIKIKIIAPSNNAGLSALKLSNGALTPAFASGTTSYTASVANSISSATITPTTSVATATVKVNGTAVTSGTASSAIPLSFGPNIITIIVTAQDGVTTKTYMLTMTRAPSTNANLSALGQSVGGLTPAFASGTTSYTENVSYASATMTLKPVSSDANATIKVNGTAVTSGTITAPIALLVGPNTITTVVTAQDGITNKTYSLTVTRALSTNATLSSIKLGSGTLSPAFAAATTSYTVSVANTVSTLTITPTTTDPNATIKINGTAVTSGTASVSIALAEGAQTVITTVVTAQNGTTKESYTVTVTRAPSTNANLSTLGQSAGGLSPSFSAGATSYTMNVSNATGSMTLKPVSSDAHATIKVNGTTVASGTITAPITLAVGANTITTVVTAQDETTTKTYTITVTRVSGGADSYNPGISVTNPTETPLLTDDGLLVHQGVSPNGDGINDFLIIDNISQYPDNKLMIVNRNGQLIYEATGYNNASKTFDGHSNKNGQMQLPGTYFYQLDYTAGGIAKHKTGFLVLKY